MRVNLSILTDLSTAHSVVNVGNKGRYKML
jgi:hypothetical protein